MLQIDKIEESSSDWLNFGKAVIKHLSETMRFSYFCVLPRTGEALLK